MDIVEFREFCLSLPHTVECTPFDETTLVMKVGGRMYTLGDIELFDHISVKCDPAKAIERRELYPEVTPAFHFNKAHWNDVRTDSSLPSALIKEWIEESYRLVVAKLPRKTKSELRL